MGMGYNEDSILFLDGDFVKAKDAKIDLFSQTLHYGFGAFEGIRAYETVNGVKVFKAHEHYARLKKSCQLVGIPFDYDVEELTQISYQLIRKNKLGDAYLRPLVFCDPEMSLSAPVGASLMIAAWDWSKYFGNRQLNVCISSYERPNPKSTKVEAKICGHYVNSILASMESKQRGFDESLMLDVDGFVAEAPGANFFYEKDGAIYTPPLGNILPGITRSTVIEICKVLDIPLQEKLFRPEDLFEIDGAFFCGTAVEVNGIASIEGSQVNKPWATSLGSVIQETYKSLVLDKNSSYVIV